MIPLTVAEVAALTSGEADAAHADAVLTDVAVDSRAVTPGALFVAIVGERVDGHDFAEAAVAGGAVAVLAARPLRAGDGTPLPCIVVDDPVLALGRLAGRVRRERLTAKVVAITGSSGKTSTKDLTAAVLSAAGRTVSAVGSFNTEVGVPLTILSADEGTEYLVVEMGMRGIGHISYLVGIADPDVGMLINVGSAHLGMLGSREAIAEAKGEIVRDLRRDAVAVLNGDDPLVRARATTTQAGIVFAGEGDDCDVRATDVTLDDEAHARFTLHWRGTGESGAVSLRVPGEHQVGNALCAAAAALALGVPFDVVVDALSSAESASRWRMEIAQSPDGVTVVNDAYNANPESMRAALKALAVMGRGRRTWAVLGEMLELGDSSMEEHDAIGRLAVRLNVSRLVCVGEGTRVMHLAAANEGSWDNESVHVPDADAAIALLRRELAPRDVVLVKASRSIGLERVAEALLEPSQGAAS
ncbi:MAG: UDP-N-acetylmuramoyl-tripeptide--D-alanyl-D-alanine ligase [Actinomycetales bacterium]|nr:UDP-N-acetylmuramoyl-tripeptide--D-alanyl-D-alanine ligase [Actinomycetales bacterium]